MSTSLSYTGSGGFCPRERDFRPYLMQVLERWFQGYERRVTLEQAHEAIQKNLEPLDRSGLPKAFARYLDDTVRFYHMGAAEYEWGSIPAAAKHLLGQTLVTKVFAVPAGKLPKNFFRGNVHFDKDRAELEHLRSLKKLTKAKRERMAELEAKGTQARADLVLYYLGPEEYVPSIPALVNDMCAGKHQNKNGDHFTSLADPICPNDRDLLGWFCLDFPFFLVQDVTVFKDLCRLYKVQP